MKKTTKILTVAALALTIGAVAKTNSVSAAQITGLTQKDDSSSYFEVEWQADLAAKAYQVEYSSDKLTWLPAAEYTTSPNLSVYSNLSAGSSYYVRVTGYTDTTLKTVSAETSDILEVVTAPSVPSMEVVQSDATTTGFTVSYKNAAGANYYVVRDTNDTVLGASSTAKVKVAGKVSAGTSIWCRSYACRRSASGYIAQGNYKYDLYKSLTKKLAAGQFGITNGFYNIDIYYFGVNTEVGNFDGISLQLQKAKGKGTKNLTKSGNSAISVKGLNGTFYKYRMRTYVLCGTTKKYSTWSSFRTFATPKNASVTASKHKVIKLNWKKIAGATAYDVYISNKQNTGYKKVKTLKAKKCSISIRKYGKKSLKKGKTYWVRIIPKAKDGKKTLKAQTYYVAQVAVPNY